MTRPEMEFAYLARGRKAIVLVDDSAGCVNILELDQDTHQYKRRVALLHKGIYLSFGCKEAVHIEFHLRSIRPAIIADVNDKQNLAFSS